MKKKKLKEIKVINEIPIPDDNVKKFKIFDPVKKFKDKLKDKLFPSKTVLVCMELKNGFHKQFIVKENNEGFKYGKKKYLFDNESKYYNISAKLWCFDYHEDLTLPLKRKIPVNVIKKTVESSGIVEVEYALNPSTLERFIVARIAEGVMKGHQIDEFFKQIRLLMIITMVAVLIHLTLFMFKTGMLQSIKIPGIS